MLPKAPGKIRLIHGYSQPAGRSLNDVIDDIKLSYKGVDKACDAMSRGGQPKQTVAVLSRLARVHACAHACASHHSDTVAQDERCRVWLVGEVHAHELTLARKSNPSSSGP